MAFEELVTIPKELLILFQALGWAVVLYVVFQIINYKLNKKKTEELEEINQNLKDIKRLLNSKKRK